MNVVPLGILLFPPSFDWVVFGFAGSIMGVCFFFFFSAASTLSSCMAWDADKLIIWNVNPKLDLGVSRNIPLEKPHQAACQVQERHTPSQSLQILRGAHRVGDSVPRGLTQSSQAHRFSLCVSALFLVSQLRGVHFNRNPPAPQKTANNWLVSFWSPSSSQKGSLKKKTSLASQPRPCSGSVRVHREAGGGGPPAPRREAVLRREGGAGKVQPGTGVARTKRSEALGVSNHPWIQWIWKILSPPIVR